MAWVEVYSGQSNLAFKLTTANLIKAKVIPRDDHMTRI